MLKQRYLFEIIRRFSRAIQIKNNEINPIFTNRNPRNLEYLRIAYKPDGYYIDKPGRCYWHKLQLIQTDRHVTACLFHYENGQVLKASTKEWAIKKQLYKTTDTSAYINLARVFAQRCIESGLVEFFTDLKPTNEQGKVSLFLKTLRENGLKLTEPDQYTTVYPWTRERSEKPWEIND
ncbi:hypothetical protein RN001_010982 [Aquatica leii]|uniref:Large ribosomal subunit protein uL18m n=1 Tax=Aquatica leii TaxID=1421715 RepID=A0AAN7S8S7_9COLE|nr:hypothetical protein RN001_010982 [Aquatica leii]